jgi:hypothetical protein
VQIRSLEDHDTALGVDLDGGVGLMTTKTTKASRDVTAEIAYLTRALKAPPTLRGVGGPVGRAGPGRQ